MTLSDLLPSPTDFHDSDKYSRLCRDFPEDICCFFAEDKQVVVRRDRRYKVPLYNVCYRGFDPFTNSPNSWKTHNSFETYQDARSCFARLVKEVASGLHW